MLVYQRLVSTTLFLYLYPLYWWYPEGQLDVPSISVAVLRSRFSQGHWVVTTVTGLPDLPRWGWLVWRESELATSPPFKLYIVHVVHGKHKWTIVESTWKYIKTHVEWALFAWVYQGSSTMIKYGCLVQITQLNCLTTRRVAAYIGHYSTQGGAVWL